MIFVLLLTCTVLFFCVFGLMPSAQKTSSMVNAVLAPKGDYEVVVSDAGAFGDSAPGVYLTRPEKLSNTSDNNFYRGNISTDILRSGKSNFYPEFTAMVMQNDTWCELINSDYFFVEAKDPTFCSVGWCLRESAPAAVYGVRCREKQYGIEEIFQVLYAGDWTYINVTNANGERSIRGFAGGANLTLDLNITFNDGAAKPDLSSQGTSLSTNVTYGRLSTDSIVTTQSMLDNIVVKTVSGDIYKGKIEKLKDRYQNNRVQLRFTESFKNDIYLIQFTSNTDGRILGQFVIDNSYSRGGVNLSRFWAVLVVLGGLLALGAASAYLVPLMIVRVNEARVNKENERIARIKNPEAYATKDKKSLKGIFSKIIYNIKTPAYKRKKEEQEDAVPQEQKVYSNRFTEMLRERQEKRDYMRKNNITSEEMERRKEREAAVAADEINSFASLRDDDENDEIATFHAAEEEISTLETGAYVQDGARFARLDSLTDDDPIVDHGNNDDGNGF